MYIAYNIKDKKRRKSRVFKGKAKRAKKKRDLFEIKRMNKKEEGNKRKKKLVFMFRATHTSDISFAHNI